MSHGIRILALSGLLVASAPFAAQTTNEQAYRYHLTDIIVGSMLPQDIISGTLPFDRTYASLTADQKAVLFNEYEGLAAGDEPPFPLYGIRNVVKPMISLAEIYNPVGPMVAAVDVDSRGKATSVTVFQSPDSELARVLSGALTFAQYKPASCQGQPCKMQFVLRLNFPDRRDRPITNIELQRDARFAVFHH
jgi:hypothetical protein